MIEQLSMDLPQEERIERDKKPNPVWAKLKEIDERLEKIEHKIATIEKSLRRH